MNFRQKLAALAVTAVAGMNVAAGTALAQFAAPPAQNYTLLLGTSGETPTGIFEIGPMVTVAIGVGVLLVLAYTAWKHIKKAGGKV